MKTVTTLLTSALLGLSLLSTTAIAGSHEGHEEEGVMVHNAWVRAVPPTAKMSAAYMELKNTTGDDDHLVSAESDVAKNVELHNVRKKEGMMEMYQVKSIGVPSKGSQALKPGSYHVMLIGLNRPLKAGDEVELTLNFMHAGAVTIKAPVQEGGMMQHKGMKH
ncbi:MAG: copper chaperone PCu(A)C [Pseudomonadota bacterium]